MWQGEYVIGGAGAVGLRDACRGQTGEMSSPRLVSKMINALLLIIPSQATWKESQDIFNCTAGVTEISAWIDDRGVTKKVTQLFQNFLILISHNLCC